MDKNITLVLSGGGARGIAHIGVIEEIESRGYMINSIAGTSMGALVGGVYAMGKLDEFKNWLYKLDKRKGLRLMDFTFNSKGLIKGDRILNIIKNFVSEKKIEDLEIEYTATAFDLTYQKEVVFSTGNLYDAIRASIAIPTILTPVIAGNSILVDGGVINNIPINNAVRTENDFLIAVNVNADTEKDWSFLPVSKGGRGKCLGQTFDQQSTLWGGNLQTPPHNISYFHLIDNTIAFVTNRLSQVIIQGNSPDLLIEISRKSAKTFDFYKIDKLIEIGRFAAKKKLDSIQ